MMKNTIFYDMIEYVKRKYSLPVGTTSLWFILLIL
jgi:hypothetical protein